MLRSVVELRKRTRERLPRAMFHVKQFRRVPWRMDLRMLTYRPKMTSMSLRCLKRT